MSKGLDFTVSDIAQLRGSQRTSTSNRSPSQNPSSVPTDTQENDTLRRLLEAAVKGWCRVNGKTGKNAPKPQFRLSGDPDKTSATWEIDGRTYSLQFVPQVTVQTEDLAGTRPANTPQELQTALHDESASQQQIMAQYAAWLDEIEAEETPRPKVNITREKNSIKAILEWDLDGRKFRGEIAPGKQLNVKAIIDVPHRARKVFCSVNTKEEFDQLTPEYVRKAQLDATTNDERRAYGASVMKTLFEWLSIKPMGYTNIISTLEVEINQYLHEGHRLWVRFDPNRDDVQFDIFIEVAPGTANSEEIEGKYFCRITDKNELNSIPKFIS